MASNTQQKRNHPVASAAAIAILVIAVLIILIVIGSQGLRNFDSALIGYAVATVFAAGALAYRYTLWIARPPT